MRKTIKKRLALVLTTTMLLTLFMGINATAFVSGYTEAVAYTGAVTGYITSTSQNDWYYFTVTESQLPAPYSIILRIPDGCVYNFDFRYRASNSTGRPSIISNETIVTGSRNRTMGGVITEPGTYFVRVYPQDGVTSSTYSYRLSIGYNNTTTYGFSLNSDSLVKGETDDWAICAEILGKYTFDKTIKYGTNTRNYKRAYDFVMSNYTTDNQSTTTSENKGTPEQTAIAADYIYSGDLLLTPKFKVENNKIYEIHELMEYVCKYNRPVIFYLENPQWGSQIPTFRKYIILSDVNIAENTISYFNPSSESTITVDYDEFLLNGMTYSSMPHTYAGTNIIESNYDRPFQAIYD